MAQQDSASAQARQQLEPSAMQAGGGAGLPDPPVPAEADLRAFPFTPIYRSRLFGSSFHARASDSEWRAAVTLWLRSWDQVPAGSLPDDDIELCRLAELGRDLRSWRKLRQGALRGWFRCGDGRLYHEVVAEGVLEAWQRKQSQSARTEKARQARLKPEPAQPVSESTEDQPLPRNGAAAATGSVTGSVTGPVTAPVTESVTASATDSNRQGYGQGQGQQQLPAAPGAGAPRAEPIFGYGLELLKARQVPERAARSFLGLMRKELGDAAALELLQACERDDITEPIPWLRKCMDGRKRIRGGAGGKAGVHLGQQMYSENWEARP